MTKQVVEFHTEAEAEYLGALRWYQERSPQAAESLAAEVGRAIERIRHAPDRWARYQGDSRRFLRHQFPFAIIHLALPDRILILVVAHGRRRPGYWKSRL
jgi:plasmid stabilization system protein ParE